MPELPVSDHVSLLGASKASPASATMSAASSTNSMREPPSSFNSHLAAFRQADNERVMRIRHGASEGSDERAGMVRNG